MAWLFLIGAILFEVAGTLALRMATHGKKIWIAGVAIGYLAAFAADALATGAIEGAEGDSFEAGKLGTYEVGADGVVLLGDPYVFDAENIGDFDF